MFLKTSMRFGTVGMDLVQYKLKTLEKKAELMFSVRSNKNSTGKTGIFMLLLLNLTIYLIIYINRWINTAAQPCGHTTSYNSGCRSVT